MQLQKSKRGFLWFLPALLGAPWVLLGAGIFILALLLGVYFALGKLIGAGLVLLGGLLTWKLHWKIGVPVMGFGALLYYNPFKWDSLEVVPLGFLG